MEPDDMRGGGFPATRHSAIERIRDADPEARREAFGDLVEGYWKPVYKHLRLTWRLDAEDARDLTQGFFADAFQKAWLERYEPGKARFRTFVRVCADRFVMNMRQSSSRLKRGGGVQTLPLDFDGAEREVRLARSRRDARAGRVLPPGVRARALRQGGGGPPRRVRGARAADPVRALRALRPRSRRGRQLRAARGRVRADADAGHQLPRAGAAALPRARARRSARVCAAATRSSAARRAISSDWRSSERPASGLSDAAVHAPAGARRAGRSSSPAATR